MTRTLYEILGISSDASPEVIKKAYRRLMKELHPDTADTWQKKRFFTVRKAYEILSDASRRDLYNTWLTKQQRQTSFSSVFKNARKRYRQHTSTRQKSAPKTVKMTIFLTPDEMRTGKRLPIYVHGTRISITLPAELHPGRQITYTTTPEDGEETRVTITTALKNTSGIRVKRNGDMFTSTEIDTNTAALGGSSEINTPMGETLSMHLKGGVRNGQIVRLKNAGMFNYSGSRGDLYVSLSVKKVIFSLKAAFGM